MLALQLIVADIDAVSEPLGLPLNPCELGVRDEDGVDVARVGDRLDDTATTGVLVNDCECVTK